MSFDKKSEYANKVEEKEKFKLKFTISTFCMIMRKLGEEKEEILKETAFGSLFGIKSHVVLGNLVFPLIQNFDMKKRTIQVNGR